MRISFCIGSLCLLILCSVLSCVSETVPSDRARDSIGIPPPPNGVVVKDPNNFTFAAVGDLHQRGSDTGRLQTILNAAQAEGDAFIVLLGDIVDQGDRPSLIAVRSTLTNLGWDGKVFTVIGNHDIFADGWTNYKELNGPSYYAFNVGNSKFIAMDTGDGTLGSDQLTWLENEVQNDRPQNLFFLSHYMPVVPGIQTYLKFPDEDEALSLMKLAVDHGVSAWLGGHYHSYLQSTIDGVLYVVAGGGGAQRMAPVYDFFFVQVTVAGSQVSAVMHKVN